MIHSNPKLGTQWAIRRVLESTDQADSVRHLVKFEAPLDAGADAQRDLMERAVEESRVRLGVDQAYAVTVEIDLKRTGDTGMLTDDGAVRDFYSRAAEMAQHTDYVGDVIAYCHSPAHMAAALAADGLAGVAGQYNLVEPWPALYLDAVADRGLAFIGMAPLHRGALATVPGPETDQGQPLWPVRWALADPRVSAVVVTMSTPQHVRQVMRAAGWPAPSISVQKVAASWRDVGYPVSPVISHPSEFTGYLPIGCKA